TLSYPPFGRHIILICDAQQLRSQHSILLYASQNPNSGTQQYRIEDRSLHLLATLPKESWCCLC
ncbi:MAG TPA: hypothetical protein PK735_09050, partial [Flavobacteriales bacterium]|nr:hypothetical protein [Flavobacteriales bacterium]